MVAGTLYDVVSRRCPHSELLQLESSESEMFRVLRPPISEHCKSRGITGLFASRSMEVQPSRKSNWAPAYNPVLLVA